MTTATQLASVRAAIARIEGAGQTFGRDGRSLQEAELKTLYDRERELIARLAAETAAAAGRGRGRIIYAVPD